MFWRNIPAHWKDHTQGYVDAAKSWWPEYLWNPDSEAEADAKSHGHIMGLTRNALDHVLLRLHPTQDYDISVLQSEDPAWFERWEKDLAIKARTTLIQRMIDLLSAFRNRKTVSVDKIKSVFSYAWDSEDPTIVSVAVSSVDSIDQATTPTTAVGSDTWARCAYHLHIYHTEETTEPNYTIADELIIRLKPTWEHWTVGQYLYAPVSSQETTPPTARFSRFCYDGDE